MTTEQEARQEAEDRREAVLEEIQRSGDELAADLTEEFVDTLPAGARVTFEMEEIKP